MTSATVVAVNVGRGKPMPTKSGVSSIDKRAAQGRVAVRLLGLDGDSQTDTANHGGPEQAVYAYATEDLDDWAGMLGRDLRPGQFGENVSTRGLDVTGALIGETWRIGTTLLQVTRPRIPCVVFQDWLAEPHWVKRFTDDGRPGAMLRVLEEGEIGAGDDLVIEDRPDHDVTIGLVFRAKTTDRSLIPRMLAAPQLTTVDYQFALRYTEENS
ncbi:MAG TPA: MOSC domain-containing protein [Acidothermaceae bacterium]|nr:MOSC domain-containing protein [Acidothermaceae bacterium]